MLKPGDELPSTRALSAELGVNPMTISKAYSYLERDGVIERRPGRPLVVKAFEDRRIEDERTEQLREGLKPILTIIRQLGIGNEQALRILREELDRDADSDSSKESTS